ncbi:MAG: hypothetical protein HFG63_11220 [Lachnospiraceae bacterium]|nr:hypothetical protein [Lachnospiraceae bacterium]
MTFPSFPGKIETIPNISVAAMSIPLLPQETQEEKRRNPCTDTRRIPEWKAMMIEDGRRLCLLIARNQPVGASFLRGAFFVVNR